MAMNTNCSPRTNDSVCIQTERIYDSCKSKECAEDLRVYFSEASQALIDNANNVRLKCAEVLYVDTDVDKIQFNNCYYNVDSRIQYCSQANGFHIKAKSLFLFLPHVFSLLL